MVIKYKYVISKESKLRLKTLLIKGTEITTLLIILAKAGEHRHIQPLIAQIIIT